MSDLATQDTPSMDDTLNELLADIQGRGVDLDNSDAETEISDVAEGKPSRERDESGRFAAKKAEADPVDAIAGELDESTTAPEAEKPPRKAPASWKKEAQEKFGTLDPLAQDEIERREADFHKGIETYKGKAQFYDQLDQTLRPFAANLQAEGASPIQAIQHFFNLDHTLRHGSAQQKAGVIQELIHRSGIAPETFAQMPPIDPNLYALHQQNQQLQQQLRQREQFSQQQSDASLNSEIQAFAQGKEHFETVRRNMGVLLHADPELTLEQVYETACWANPQVRASLIAQQQDSARADAIKKAQDAKRSAAVNIPRRGAALPSSTPTGTMDETIEAKMQQLGY